jgi:hypothetical protein
MLSIQALQYLNIDTNAIFYIHLLNYKNCGKILFLIEFQDKFKNLP